MSNLPTVVTPRSELTREHVAIMSNELPNVSVAFVHNHAPECEHLARHYQTARERLLKNYVGDPRNGGDFAFDPKLYAKASNAFGALMDHIPTNLVPEWWLERQASA